MFSCLLRSDILPYSFKVIDSNAIKIIKHILLTNFMAKTVSYVFYVEWVFKFAKLLIIHALCYNIYAD